MQSSTVDGGGERVKPASSLLCILLLFANAPDLPNLYHAVDSTSFSSHPLVYFSLLLV
jgi:hypothetical protein